MDEVKKDVPIWADGNKEKGNIQFVRSDLNIARNSQKENKNLAADHQRGEPRSGGFPFDDPHEIKENKPPAINKGVRELKVLEFGIHFVKLTIFTGMENLIKLYNKWLRDDFGELELSGNTRHYENRYITGNGFQLTGNPYNKEHGEHGLFVIPGALCDCFDINKLKEFCYENRGLNIKCTRLDLKIDNCPFTPHDIDKSIDADKFECTSHKENMYLINNKYELDELGNMGTATYVIGSGSSERYLRIYNKHGFTRMEMECKGDTANGYFYGLMMNLENKSNFIMGHMMDFLRIDAPYWNEFTNGYERKYMKINKIKDIELIRMETYFYNQCAPTISILREIKGKDYINHALNKGWERAQNDDKYRVFLHKYGLNKRDG